MTAHATASRVLPFAALVGQEPLKVALTLLAVNGRLGGLLIRGHKGTAKSTAARALASLLPDAEVVAGCRYGCPVLRPEAWCAECQERDSTEPTRRRPAFVTVPLGVTEDQLLGSIDLQAALQRGESRFRPGLLAEVNGGVLYVDEVNLLDDHVVDLLLDSAAMGQNVVAREGVRVSHPAEFMLVGTMNPEEGELRPQLLDRFGLCVEIRSIEDAELRAEIISRTLSFESDPEGFRQRWAAEQQEIRGRIARARELLAQIEPPRSFCLAAARLALSLEVHGHRADVLLVKTAATLAALQGRTALADEDLAGAAEVVLPHRLRRQPFEEQATAPADLRARAREAFASPQPPAEKKK